MIFKRLLLRLITESTFIFNSNYYRQIDGATMGGPLSVVLSDLFMIKMEKAALKSQRKPKFYKRFVDDILTRRKKDKDDKLFKFLNNYHTNIKLTIEVNPTKFLDTNIIHNNDGTILTSVHRKVTKVTPHWTSSIPKRYKRNAIYGDLSRAYRISSNFQCEINIIRQKFLKASYPLRYINSVIKDFKNKKNAVSTENDNIDEFIIPPGFFEIPQKSLFLELPYCPENEILAKDIIKKIHEFTNNEFKIIVKWITKKIRNLFNLKDKNPYPACQINRGTYSCDHTMFERPDEMWP